MKLGRAVAINDKRDPGIPTTTLLKYFSMFMSKSFMKFLVINDVLHDTMHYDPHMVMEDQDIKKEATLQFK